MNIEIPPVFFYGLGAMLVVFGAVRAYYFGWRRRERNIDEGPMPRSAVQKRHLAVGILWVVMGSFLIASTINAVLRWGPPTD